MKKGRRAVRLLVIGICMGMLSGCAAKQEDTKEKKEDNQTESVRIGALKGPTAMGMAQLLEDENYKVTIAASPDEITPLIVKGEIDIAAIPANLSAMLYQKTNKQVSAIAVNTLGVLYVVENGNHIQSAQDLKGKTIYASGKGATPEYVLYSVLEANGIRPDVDVTIEFKSEHTEVMTALMANPEAAGLLPEPFVTTAQMKNAQLRVALDMNEMWEKGRADGSRLITGVTVVRNEFLKENPEAVQAFLAQYKQSVAFVNSDTEDAARIIGSHDIVAEEVAIKAIPKCSIVFEEGEKMKTMLSGYLDTLFLQNPETIGGAVPDEAFYYR